MSAVEHGGAARGWLELSANLNPCGPPDVVEEAVAGAGWSAYADLETAEPEQRLAADAHVDASCVLLTAGATEGLRLVAHVFIGSGDRAVVLGPTYGEYARLAGLRNATVREIRASAPEFAPPIGALLEAVVTERPAVAFICDPNNPTGALLERSELLRIREALRAATVLVVDQSFGSFAPESVTAPELISDPQVVLVRSLTKVLASPGLRLGYVLAHPATIAALRAVRDPWSVSAHACAAARVASWRLGPGALMTISTWRARLSDSLRELGFGPVPSAAPFLLVHVGSRAEQIVRSLGERRIAVRWCASFGLPDHMRIAVRPPTEQDLLIAALRALQADLHT